jgi:hypothetical protein
MNDMNPIANELEMIEELESKAAPSGLAALD